MKRYESLISIPDGESPPYLCHFFQGLGRISDFPIEPDPQRQSSFVDYLTFFDRESAYALTMDRCVRATFRFGIPETRLMDWLFRTALPFFAIPIRFVCFPPSFLISSQFHE
jgi:hypothetical protein